jgi:hypothetical protein
MDDVFIISGENHLLPVGQPTPDAGLEPDLCVVIYVSWVQCCDLCLMGTGETGEANQNELIAPESPSGAAKAGCRASGAKDSPSFWGNLANTAKSEGSR